MNIVVYWTDALVYVLFLSIIAVVIAIVRSPLLYERFKYLLKRPRYIISLIILIIFGSIGFLDTIHFKRDQSHTVESVLDVMLSPRNTQVEKTYSAPLAKVSYVPELVVAENSKVSEIYPPLRYPGTHLFGTDAVGRDVFYVAMKSIRTGLVIGTVTTLVMLPFAIFFGMWAGYFRGWVDDAIQYIYTTISSIPGVLLIAATIVSLQMKIEQDPDLRLLVLCIILGVTSWTGLCRLLRGETLKLRESEFVMAAKVLGVKSRGILLHHIFPNLLHIVIITFVLDFSGLVLAEAVLSYVGVGVDPTAYSFGNMINASRLEMAREPVVWWSLSAALILMFALVFSANIFSESVLDAFSARRT